MIDPRRRTGPAGIVHAIIGRPLVLRLFQNDIAPSPDDDVRSLQEADFPGYEARDLSPEDWDERAGPPPVAELLVAQEFRRTTDGPVQPIFGYYLTDPDGGLRLAARRLPEPALMQFDGDRLYVTPLVVGTQAV